MHTLTESEKRTIRIAGLALAAFLILFFGARGWRLLEARRTAYQQLLVDAQRLKRDLQPYEKRALQTQRLREFLQIDPERLSRASLVAEASAAIQNAARRGGLQLGPIRESPARSSTKELSSIQLEGAGPIPAVMSFLYRLETIGSPLIIDSIQISPDTKPGQIKVSFTIIILDYDQWKHGEARRA